MSVLIVSSVLKVDYVTIELTSQFSVSAAHFSLFTAHSFGHQHIKACNIVQVYVTPFE